MKIYLKDLQEDRAFIQDEEIDPEDLDIDVGIMTFPEPLRLHVEAWKNEDGLMVSAHVEGERSLVCSLCLEEFNNLFEKDITLHYDIKGLDLVIVDAEVRDEIILEHPIRIMCRADCRGLCPFCGSNLNTETCDCKPNE